jgi:signal transduction histidine kinase
MTLHHDNRPQPPGPPLDAVDLREEANALRRLARQMAAVADTPALLRILADAAVHQAHTQGAAVIQANGSTARVECAVGELLPIDGMSFPQEGSLTARAIDERGPVLATQYDDHAFPLASALRSIGITQVLCVPLLAHDAVLGVLLAARGADQPLFMPYEVQRLQVIADHASLALWKAQLLDQAQAADRAKSRFLATISHELLTPLTTLTGYGELLADQVIGPMSEPQLEILGRIITVTHDLSAMIEEILAFTSLEEGRDAVRPSELLAADLVHSVAASLEHTAAQRGLSLVATAPPEPIRLVTDVDKLRQVLVHLAANAIKFTDKGRVDITVARVADEVHFSVRDTGIGIAPEDMDRLFQPFTQLDQGLTRRHGGTGLGLHIAHRLAAMLGGGLEVASAPGEGSVFTLILGT